VEGASMSAKVGRRSGANGGIELRLELCGCIGMQHHCQEKGHEGCSGGVRASFEERANDIHGFVVRQVVGARIGRSGTSP
jgi:hypothetical protein